MQPAKPTGLTFAQFQRAQHERASRLAALRGKIHLRYTAQGTSVSGGGRFFLKLPTFAYWEVRDPLGRTHLQVGAALPEVTAYYPRENKVVVDASRGRKFLREFFPSGLDVEQLSRLWLGVAPLSAIGKSDRWEWDGAGFYTAELKTTYGQVEMDIDGTTAALRRYELKNNTTALKVTYEDFDKECLGAASCPRDSDKIALAHTAHLKLLSPSIVSMEVELDELRSEGVPNKRDAYLPTIPSGTPRKVLN